jgi:hypothetical protein
MVDDKLRIFIEATDKASAALSSVSAKVVGLVAAYASFQTVKRVMDLAIDQIHQGIEAASAQEQADIRLANAVSTLGGNTSAMTAHLKAQAAALQLSTVYTDEQVQAAQALLASLGRLSGDGLDRATKAAVALAQGLGVDLESAATLLSKAAQGNTQQLARYGIVLDESLSKSQKFEAVLAFVEGRFGTLAEAMGTSFQGRLIQAEHAFGELQETLGNLIIKNDTVVEALKQISIALADLNASFATQDLSEQVSRVTILLLGFAEKCLIAATAASALFDVLIHEGNALAKIAGFSTLQERVDGLKELFLSGFEISPVTKDLRELMNAAHDVTTNVEIAHASLAALKQELLDIQKGGVAPSELVRFLELIELINKTKIAPKVSLPMKDLGDQVKIIGLGISVTTDKVDALRLALARIEEVDVVDPFRPIAEGAEATATLLNEYEAALQGIDDVVLALRDHWNAVGEAQFEATSGKHSKAVEELNEKLELQGNIMQALIDTAAEFGSQFVQLAAAGELSFKTLASLIKDLIVSLIAYIVKLLIAYALQKALSGTPFGVAVGFGYGLAAGASGGGGGGGFGPSLSGPPTTGGLQTLNASSVPNIQGLSGIGSPAPSLALQQSFLGVSDAFVRDLNEAQSRVARSYGVSIVPLGSLV